MISTFWKSYKCDNLVRITPLMDTPGGLQVDYLRACPAKNGYRISKSFVIDNFDDLGKEIRKINRNYRCLGFQPSNYYNILEK